MPHASGKSVGRLIGCVSVVIALAIVVPRVSTQIFVAFPVWVISSLERAGPADPVGPERSARLYAALGEYEAFQIVVRPPESGLHGVRVRASDLVSKDQNVIHQDHVAVYRARYMYVSSSSPDWQGGNRPLGAGWYADPLIPVSSGLLGGDNSGGASFHIDPGRNQPIWVEVFVPRDTAPGLYEGTVSVFASQGTVEVPLSIYVWNFVLPVKPSLRSSFGYWASTRQGIEELLRHKVMPQRVGSASCVGEACSGAQQILLDLAGRLGLSMTDVGLWSGADRDNCSMRPPPSVDEFRAAAATHLESLYLFNYTADEVQQCRNLFPSMKAWARNMHQAGIKNLVVMEPTPELFDDGSGTGQSAVDIWVVLPKIYTAVESFAKQAMRKGDEVWSYNTLAQDSY